MRTKLPPSTLQDTFTLTTVISEYRYENQLPLRHLQAISALTGVLSAAPYVKKGIWKLKE